MKDHIVEAIRESRRDIEKECSSKGQTLGAHYRACQAQYKGRLTKRTPQKALRTKIA